jgi:hypothetical protein
MVDSGRLLGWLLTSAETSDAKVDRYGVTWRVHVGILARLASVRLEAEAAGWTALALERQATLGSLRLFGVAPGEDARREVPSFTPLDLPSRSGESTSRIW